jgi:hypothetical protein
MSENLVKYEKILEDYRNGIYGNEHLSVQTILRMADADNLLDKLSVEDLEYLIDKTSDVKMRQMYLNLREKRRNRQIG